MHSIWLPASVAESPNATKTHRARMAEIQASLHYAMKWTIRPQNSMKSIELELISVVANPKGGNRALRVRTQGRCTFNVFLTSHEKLVSYKMLCLQLNWSLSPLWRTRREETERYESESGVGLFLTISSHLMKHLFLVVCGVFNEIGAYLRCGEPEGRKPNAASQNPGSMYF